MCTFAFAKDFEVDINNSSNVVAGQKIFSKNVQLVMVVRVLELVEHLAFLAVNINLEVTKFRYFRHYRSWNP